MTGLLAVLADPIRFTRLARVVVIGLTITFNKCQSHALEWLIAVELYRSTNNHDGGALGKLVLCERRIDIINESFLV